MNARPAELFLYDDRIAWASAGFQGGETLRPACALLIGAERPLAVRARGTVLHSHAVLVGPNVARSLDAEDAGFYSLTLDPAHPGCRYLRDTVLAGRGLLDLRGQFDPGVARAVRSAISGGLDCAQSFQLSEKLLRHFFPGIVEAAPIETRVARVAAWLRRELPARARMSPLGALVQLSAGRLTHLFSAELGLSIRSYLRWVKMSRAIELLGSKRTVTEAAAAIGFADAAHFTRVLRSYYSAAPSFIKNRGLVNVHVCGQG